MTHAALSAALTLALLAYPCIALLAIAGRLGQSSGN
jgi:hypothetical protein